MPKFTVEITYMVPVYRHVTVDVASPEDAPDAAIGAIVNSSDITEYPERIDYECPSNDYCTGIWEGEEAYTGTAHDVPAEWERDYRLSQE